MKKMNGVLATLCLVATAQAAQADRPTPRLWTDGAGGFASLTPSEAGPTLHLPATGAFYRYAGADGRLTPDLAHAPALELGKALTIGGKAYHPAAVREETVEVATGGAVLVGRLTVPDGPGRFGLVINQQGSERSGAMDGDWTPAWYAQAGLATFTFDKRGTGRSGGAFSHDFDRMARDLEAVAARLANHPRIDHARIGLAGYSQGAYVAALAAGRSPGVAFLISAYGMTEPPIEEDLQETRQALEAAYPGLDWAEFEPFARACGAAFALERNDLWPRVRRMKRHWAALVDPGALPGTLTGDGCLRYPPVVLRLFGRGHLPEGLDWAFDPAPHYAALDIPVFFAFGLADRAAPPETSIARVRRWRAEGRDFALHTYPGAGHGIRVTRTNAEGQSYRIKDPRYIEDLIAWLKER